MAATEQPRRTPRRFDGKRVAMAFGVVLIAGTVVASVLAYLGHQIGDEGRERFEAARAAER